MYPQAHEDLILWKGLPVDRKAYCVSEHFTDEHLAVNAASPEISLFNGTCEKEADNSSFDRYNGISIELFTLCTCSESKVVQNASIAEDACGVPCSAFDKKKRVYSHKKDRKPRPNVALRIVALNHRQKQWNERAMACSRGWLGSCGVPSA